MIKHYNSNKARLRRHYRLRRHLSGTAARPRLSVFRSSKHVYVQIVDDAIGTTIVAASSMEEGMRNVLPAAPDPDAEPIKGIAGIEANHKVATARAVGRVLAQRALEKGITKVVFDRGGYPYHGRIAAVATGAREGGLDF